MLFILFVVSAKKKVPSKVTLDRPNWPNSQPNDGGPLVVEGGSGG